MFSAYLFAENSNLSVFRMYGYKMTNLYSNRDCYPKYLPKFISAKFRNVLKENIKRGYKILHVNNYIMLYPP